ncbi:MAG: acyltransferase domain-containing protein [Clostridia bacterium]|nr:acyltransferase domain-containing protein [Clostridia bacterium]
MDEFDFAFDFMRKEKFPEDAVQAFSGDFDKIRADADVLKRLIKLKNKYLAEKRRYKALSPAVRKDCKRLGMSGERADFVFLLLCLEGAKKKYERNGLSDELFYATFADLKYKLLECKAVKDEWGTFVAYWYDGFFRLKRFCYGRFQYEITRYAWLKYDGHGVKLRKNTKVINFHIPSSGEPITYENRLDSYKQAYEIYRHLFKNGKAVFVCFSWLLYKEHYDFLPHNSNIIDFMNDFDIIKSVSLPVFNDAWRVFGADAKKTPQELPEKTSLQRAYKKRLADNKLASGYGYGIIVFDGEKILTRK